MAVVSASAIEEEREVVLGKFTLSRRARRPITIPMQSQGVFPAVSDTNFTFGDKSIFIGFFWDRSLIGFHIG